jgi:nicotinamidase-related amidase
MTATAVLFVDVTNEVLHEKGTLGGDLPKVAHGLLDGVRRLVSWARTRDVPVIWIRTAFRPGYIDATRSMRASAADLNGRLVDGTWGAELVDGLGRRSDDIVITKKRPSAFFATELNFVLRGLGIERLILAGTSTNWAIESTARDADSLDFQVVIPRDATGARMGELHEPALRSIASRYGAITTVAEIVSAGTGLDATGDR